MPPTLFVVDDTSTVEPLHAIHTTTVYNYRLAPQPIGGMAKRAFDVTAAAAGLIALAPFLLLFAALIRLETPGPALYRQRRTGFRGRTFTIFKFRSMRTMERGRGVEQARPGDPRVTRLGRFLRATSIDELPQLLNVLRGDMSLVGPRPHALRHDHAFFRVADQYPRRFLARPGITGEAQVSGARGVTETDEQIERRLLLDLDYVDDWSFGRDISILFRTVRLLLGDRHAC